MKSLIAVLVLVPSFAQALSLRPQEIPSVIDGCIPGRPGPKPLPFPKPNPKPWDDASLDNLFTGSALKQKGSEAAAPVSAGDWTVEPRGDAGLSKFSPLPGEVRVVPLIGRAFSERGNQVPSPKLRNVNCGDKDGCKSEVGKTYEDIIHGVTTPIRIWVDRDRTQESRDTYGGCRMKGTCPK